MEIAKTVPLSQGEIQLSQVAFIEGVPYATRRAIGEWLEYEEPKHGISKILTRNSYIERYARVVKLTTLDSKKRDVPVYHPMGFLLIAMESGTDKAKKMKQAIAAFVWDHMKKPELSFKEEMELRKLQRTLVADITKVKDAFSRTTLLASLEQVQRHLGEPLPSDQLIGQDPQQLTMNMGGETT